MSHETMLDSRLNKRHLAYTALAGAGAACSSFANAEVIYTPANQSIGKNAFLFIDLNHDGATDLTIHESCFATNIDPPQNRLVETPSPYLQVMEKFARPGNLIQGTEIGAPRDYFMGRGNMVSFNNVYGAYVYGYWGFALNHYSESSSTSTAISTTAGSASLCTSLPTTAIQPKFVLT